MMISDTNRKCELNSFREWKQSIDGAEGKERLVATVKEQLVFRLQRYASWTNMIVSIVSESGVKAEGDVTCLVKFTDITFSEQN